jgi:hypothetical protein
MVSSFEEFGLPPIHPSPLSPSLVLQKEIIEGIMEITLYASKVFR